MGFADCAATCDLPPRMTYSVDEVARVTGVSRDVLYDEVRSGRLRALRFGKRLLRVRPEDVDEWLEESTRGGDER